MSQLISSIIDKELRGNSIFNVIFKDFEFPKLEGIDKNLNLAYESNEYIGYYKKDIYFDLIPRKENSEIRGILKLTFVSSTKNFDIKKAMHQTTSGEETHIVSTTFKIYNKENGWDAVRYSYTL